MTQDPGSLSNLRDIATPPPVPWWPLAPGCYVVITLAAVALLFFAIRGWRRWKANAYRREALRVLQAASASTEIATILKRTALAAYPRTEVASLTGDAWCDWLEKSAPGPISPSARESLARSVFARADIDLEEMRRYAFAWIKGHRVEASNNSEPAPSC
jgi:hypothetical protein